MPKWIVMIGSLLVLILAPLWRKTYFSLIQRALPTRKLLFIGLTPSVLKIKERLYNSSSPDMTILGYLETKDSLQAPGVPYLGPVDDLQNAIERHHPDSIVVSVNDWDMSLPIRDFLDLRFSDKTVEDISTTYQTVFRRVSTHDLRLSQMLFGEELYPRAWNVMLQRCYSFAIAFIAFVLLLPVMAIVALLVKLSSPGPVLLCQKRVGLHDKVFRLYKFRSMREDAEATTGPVWAQKDDPRVTPIGRLLRRTRLDELPQLFNVLLGEMSIVGPRPERPEFVTMLASKIPYYNLRHCVKPGITGWAQINHKYGDTIEDTSVAT
jgi:exopolysaccharide biosynthesis polyprenyl glycosylphosphotransferase